MSDKPEIKTEMNAFGSWAILFLFWVFWWQGGWYRIDCALHIGKACDLIAAEYQAKAKP